jgi:ABC-type glycerol-3-phosphate transport system substrate-binding protein
VVHGRWKDDVCRTHGFGHHGFLYNKAIFKELGLTVPETEKDFLAVLDKIKASGKYFPLAQSVIDDHPDTALGLNSASKNKEAAKTFLSWVASDEFAQLYANALPGFFPLADVKYSLEDPVAQEFVSWRKDNATSFRCSYQILSRNANPNNEDDLWNACAQILNGTQTPQQAADFVQKDLASWYKPQQAN